MPYPPTISIPAATSSDHAQALREVSNFATTDMGRPGAGPWTYRNISPTRIMGELTDMSDTQTTNHGVNAVSFQPCSPSIHQNQDRYIAESWDLADGTWLFNSVLDGHLNNSTVDFVQRVLPRNIRHALQSVVSSSLNSLHPSQISQMLRNCIASTDDILAEDLYQRLAPDAASLSYLTDSDIRRILQADPSAFSAAARCLGGTTVVLSLTDPLRRNLWIANLGGMPSSFETHEVLCSRSRTGAWTGRHINEHHNAGINAAEAQRVHLAHPGEIQALQDGRILGFLEPTRALGDLWLKNPFMLRVLSNMNQDWISPSSAMEYKARMRTPPYVSNVADVHHLQPPNSACLLILASDGLSSTEAYEDCSLNTAATRWARAAGAGLSSPNVAVCVLRDALGGEDIQQVSRNMTVEMDERWMDDITIIVQHL
ncbi:protein serine/threonine phosphatase 2C [Fistulina hepatica ATCC 64428]|uniref:Protein serine/threonine phosphatase 2C n=1 Tax=Fistulina hepatica ATCC 64428 TaxID=1128425 RepID=A0A0D7AH58_9AGAR|nr:protein serine/threonine phosphatase 2C [Fistulina hepatica ATCC 64428]